MIKALIDRLPLGYSEGWYQGVKYGITKTVFNSGRSSKVFARELGGNGFISLNLYETSQQTILKPCEMPEAKVIAFLKKVELKGEKEE